MANNLFQRSEKAAPAEEYIGQGKTLMNTWQNFENEARAVEKKTILEASELVNLLQDSVGLLADAFTIAENANTTDATLAKMSLLSQIFATLKCSVDLAIRGFYSQSINLIRSVYENWVAFHYLSQCPDKAHLWLHAHKKKRPPGHSAMLKALGDEFNPLKGQMRGWYDTLCRFAHPDAVNLLPLISNNFLPDETSIHFGTTFKEQLFTACAYSISLWAGVLLSDVALWVPSSKDWHNEFAKLHDKIFDFIEKENDKYNSESQQPS